MVIFVLIVFHLFVFRGGFCFFILNWIQFETTYAQRTFRKAFGDSPYERCKVSGHL